MFERKSYPFGVPCWVDTIQPDVDAAVAFYSSLFGWECEDQMPPDAGGHYYSAKLHGLDVAAIGGPAAAPKGMWQSYVAVESADDAARRVEKAGGRIVTEPTDAMDAGRYATFADLAGAEFSVWQARRHIGAQLCNEPGTWNFSELNTRDPEEAARFYGDVFDWEVEDFSMGASNFTIFKLAGYGKFLQENNPDLTGDLGGAPRRLRRRGGNARPPGRRYRAGTLECHVRHRRCRRGRSAGRETRRQGARRPVRCRTRAHDRDRRPAGRRVRGEQVPTERSRVGARPPRISSAARRCAGMPERGELLGEGASCRVYSWGEDRVVKVFRRAFGYLAPIEAERVAAVHEAGAPTPAVHGIVSVEDRVGLVFDRIRGPSLLDELGARRLTPAEVGQRTAELHIAVQDLSSAALPQLADTLRDRGIDDMPNGMTVFHGDFHPANILLEDGHPWIIDWSGAHSAPAAADVACAALAIGFRGLQSSHPDVAHVHRARARLRDAYLGAYRALRPAALADFQRWYDAIARLLLAQEPDTAYPDELLAFSA